MVNFNAFISGFAGTSLSDQERAFFAETRPCGLILFARNCESIPQLRKVAADYRDSVESDEALVLIDQEGGRVQRLKPPRWRQMPPARIYGDLYVFDPETARAAAFASARLIAEELRNAGITVNCTPVLDVPEAGAHDIIGDRAFSFDPDVVSDLDHGAAEVAYNVGVEAEGAVADDIVRAGLRHVEHWRAVDGNAGVAKLCGNQSGAGKGGCTGGLRIEHIEIAIDPCRRHLPPLWRAEALHPAAFLVDQDECHIAFHRVTIIGGDLA